MSFNFLNQLPSPEEIKKEYPLPEKLAQIKKERDAAIRKVLTGEDNRFLVIIGPCSADSEEPVCDYVSRLTKIAEDVKDRLIIIPRVYTNKPRTTGEGKTLTIRHKIGYNLDSEQPGWQRCPVPAIRYSWGDILSRV